MGWNARADDTWTWCSDKRRKKDKKRPWPSEAKTPAQGTPFLKAPLAIMEQPAGAKPGQTSDASSLNVSEAPPAPPAMLDAQPEANQPGDLAGPSAPAAPLATSDASEASPAPLAILDAPLEANQPGDVAGPPAPATPPLTSDASEAPPAPFVILDAPLEVNQPGDLAGPPAPAPPLQTSASAQDVVANSIMFPLPPAAGLASDALSPTPLSICSLFSSGDLDWRFHGYFSYVHVVPLLMTAATMGTYLQTARYFEFDFNQMDAHRGKQLQS